MNDEFFGYEDGLAARYMQPGLSEQQQKQVAWESYCSWVSLSSLEEYTEGWKRGYNEPGTEETRGTIASSNGTSTYNSYLAS